jgi:CO/xanthine dehydrogenase FAD-binding subunit
MRADHPDATVLAGGTDIMVYLEAGSLHPTRILDLWGVDELRGIGGGHFGALCTYTQVIRHGDTPDVLRESALTVGAAQIQNRGTLGGNIANASPAGDTLPVWLALDASFEVASIRGARLVPASDELLTAIHVPPVRGRTCFRKVGTRMAQSISKVVFAGRYLPGEEARLAFGSVGPIPARLPGVEAAMVTRGPVVADLVGDAIAPIDDVRSTGRYRRRVARNIVEHWFSSLR